MEEFYCKICQKIKPKSEFYFRYNRRITPCKQCKKDYYKTWATKNPEYHKKWKKDHADKIKEYNKKYYMNNDGRDVE